MNNNELELYIHIPFCARKCAYCDFLSFAAPERVWRDYVNQLIEEIYGQSACFQDRVVTTIFLGGGTPSIPVSYTHLYGIYGGDTCPVKI